MIVGIRPPGRLLSFSSTRNPLFLGIIISSTIRSGFSRSAIISPAFPSRAARIRKPLFSRTVRIDSRISWSSSTIRIVRCWGGMGKLPRCSPCAMPNQVGRGAGGPRSAILSPSYCAGKGGGRAPEFAKYLHKKKTAAGGPGLPSPRHPLPRDHGSHHNRDQTLGLRGRSDSPPGRAAAPFLENPIFEKEG